MKIIIHQNYINKKTREMVTIDSVIGDDIIVKNSNGSSINLFKLEEFELLFIENFSKRVFVAKQGQFFIKVTYNEIIEDLNGLGLCDKCADLAVFNAFVGTANLIPVLNMIFCDRCFAEWEKNSKYFEEDKNYENKKTQRYLAILK